eukprot:3252430-Pleurochrysis_carterae.AAC.1
MATSDAQVETPQKTHGRGKYSVRCIRAVQKGREIAAQHHCRDALAENQQYEHVLGSFVLESRYEYIA